MVRCFGRTPFCPLVYQLLAPLPRLILPLACHPLALYLVRHHAQLVLALLSKSSGLRAPQNALPSRSSGKFDDDNKSGQPRDALEPLLAGSPHEKQADDRRSEEKHERQDNPNEDRELQ